MSNLIVVVQVEIEFALCFGPVAVLAAVIALGHHAADNQCCRSIVRNGIQRLENNRVIDFIGVVADFRIECDRVS